MELKKINIDPNKNFNYIFGDKIDGTKVNNVEKRFLMFIRKKQQLKLPLSENEKKVLL